MKIGMNKTYNFTNSIRKGITEAVIILSVFALIMGVGYALCPETMQGGIPTTLANRVGYALVRIGGAVCDNAGMVMAVCFGAALTGAKADRWKAGAAGLMSFLIMTALLTPYTISSLFPGWSENADVTKTFMVSANMLTGMLAGGIAGLSFRQDAEEKIETVWKELACTAAGSLLSALVLAVLWPLASIGVMKFCVWMSTKGIAGAAGFTALNRLLTPFGLRPACNEIFLNGEGWIGDLPHYWAGENTVVNGVSQPAGMYMSGFFAPMMGGIPGLCLAVYHYEKQSGKKVKYASLLLLGAVLSFFSGSSEYIELLALAQCPLLFLCSCLLFGVFALLSNMTGFRAGFSLSAGLTDLIFSSLFPGAFRTWMILPLGLLAFGLWYVMTSLILKYKGRRH